MKITGLGLTETSITAQPAAPDAAAASAEAPALAAASSAEGYAPSPQFRLLIDLVRQQADVREERVQAALQRLQQGYYQSAASAEKTAEALLNRLD